MSMVHQLRFTTCAIATRFVLLAVTLLPCKANLCSDRSNLDTCYQTIEPLLEDDKVSGLPTTKKQLDVMCEAFQTGMKCIDEFAKHCMKPRDQNYLQMTVAGARQMMKHLCDDSLFQNEYLKHSGCYADLSEDWDLCTLQMKRVVEEYRSRKNQITEADLVKNSCCAKYEFLVCTETVSFKKCSKEAAAFMRNIAETLSGPMLHGKCKEMKPNPCETINALHSRSIASQLTSQAFILVISYIFFYFLLT